MKKIIAPTLCLLLTALPIPRSWAQDQNKNSGEEIAKKRYHDQTGTPVKVQIVFNEYDGEKKVKSLPYTISFNATLSLDVVNQWTKLRNGNRVPITTGNGQMTYLDVGTNIDGRGVRNDDGRYSLQLNVERSWVDGTVSASQKPSDATGLNPCQSTDPIIQQFKSEMNVTVRDGETVETTLATDPLSGKVTKVQITLTTVK